jgi:hypothetical protein
MVFKSNAEMLMNGAIGLIFSEVENIIFVYAAALDARGGGGGGRQKIYY